MFLTQSSVTDRAEFFIFIFLSLDLLCCLFVYLFLFNADQHNVTVFSLWQDHPEKSCRFVIFFLIRSHFSAIL